VTEELLAHHLEGGGDQGDGAEVVVLLNGGMMTWASWEPVAAELRGDHRVLGCDFRGQLRSPGEGPPRLADHAADVVALLDALELGAVHLLGTSFGAEVGLLTAALHPERVRTLAAVTAVDRTPPGMPENSRELQAKARDVLAGGDATAFFDAFVDDVYSPAFRRTHAEALAVRRQRTAELPESWYRGLLGILTCVADFDLSPWLGKIASPTLVVHAAADAVMPEERVRALASAIPGAELRVHPRSGHGLVFEDPGWLVGVYRDFLDRHAGAAGGGG